MLLAFSSVSLAFDIVKDGRPAAAIVTPDNPDAIVSDAVTCLNSYIEKVSGAKLDVFPESRAPSGNLIVLGATKLAEREGLDVSTLKYDGFVHKVAGNKFFILGPDRDFRSLHKAFPNASYTAVKASSERFLWASGTLQGVIRFHHDHLGVRWFIPTPEGESVPKSLNIAVPNDLNVRWEPPFGAAQGGYVGYSESQPDGNWAYSTGSYWEAANSFRIPMNLMYTGGHSWDLQLSFAGGSFEEIFKKHPEYFYFRNGRRQWSPVGNMLCTSNPEVVDLLTTSMQKLFDLGWDIVQYNQSDGYRRCTCDKCEAMDNYRIDGMGSEGNPAERLLIPFNEMAERCYRSHPDKKIMTLVYGPNETPSKKIARFPPNVLLQVSAAGSFERQKQVLEQWEDKAQVYAVWLYWFGCYQTPGVTVKLTPKAAAERLRFLHEHGVQFVYWGFSGGGENWGNEGPVYYLLGQLLHDPYQDYSKILAEYYEGVYAEAAPAMTEYFNLLYQQLDSEYLAHESSVLTAADFFVRVYPPAVLAQLENSLSAAEKMARSEKARRWLALTRNQFDYIKVTVEVIQQYRAFQNSKSRGDLLKLKEKVGRRNNYLQELADLGKDKAAIASWYPGYHFFVKYAARNALPKAWVTGRLDAPFTWNFEDPDRLLASARAAVVIRAASPLSLDGKLDDAAWKEAARYPLPDVSGGASKCATTVQLAYDDKALYVGFECEEPNLANMKIAPVQRDGPVWEQECLEIFLDAQNTQKKYMHFIFNPREGNFYDARKGYIQNLAVPIAGEDVTWNPGWRYAFHADSKSRRWTAEAAVPFASLGMQAPRVGDIIGANFGRERYMGASDGSGTAELSLWSPSLEGRNFGDPASFGVLHFGNLLAGAGFENAGGKGSEALGANVHIERTIVHSGDCSLRHEIALEDSVRGHAVTTLPPVKVEGGGAYRVGVWINIPKDVEKGKSLGVDTGLEMTVTLSGAKGRIQDEGRRTYRQTDGWTEFFDTFDMPREATHLSVTLRTSGCGTVYIDDVSVIRVDDGAAPSAKP